MALLTRQEMEQKLGQLFPPRQATGLTEVLDNFREMEVQRAADTRELKEGLAALTVETRKLAEAQQRTDLRVGELAEAQRHTDQHVGELAEAQRHTDQHVGELAEAQRHTDQHVGELAEAQRHTDQRLGELAEAQWHTDQHVGELAEAQLKTEGSLTRLELAVEKLALGFGQLRDEVGGLANRFGFNFEEFVAALLPPYLERHQRISGLTLERRYFDLGSGRVEEVDLAGEGVRDGQPVKALVECHVTLGGSEVRRLAEKLDAVTGTLGGRETLRVIVAMNIHPTAEQAAQESGVLLVPYSRINRERG